MAVTKFNTVVLTLGDLGNDPHGDPAWGNGTASSSLSTLSTENEAPAITDSNCDWHLTLGTEDAHSKMLTSASKSHFPLQELLPKKQLHHLLTLVQPKESTQSLFSWARLQPKAHANTPAESRIPHKQANTKLLQQNSAQ